MAMRIILAEMEDVGAQIARTLSAGDVIGLSGGLGAGKTTLARAILRALGLVGEAPSPSFAIVQPYGMDELRLPVLHVDLYRIEESADIAELGLWEARTDHALLIEWPERLGNQAPPDMAMIHLAIDEGGRGDAARCLTVALPPAWEGRWPLLR